MTAGHEGGIRWRAVASASDAWFSLSPAPAPNVGFTEAADYLFEKPAAGWSLRVDDEPLEDAADAAYWRWEPRFFAGEVTAELFGPTGAASELFLLDVSPEPSKIGRQIFAQMLDELWEADPVLVIGTEPGTRRIGDLGSTQNAWLEFARFRRYVPEFMRAVVPVLTNPRRALYVRRIAAPLRQVRRVDRQTALALARSPAASSVVGRVGGLVRQQDDRIDVPSVEETLDSAANRAMLALVLALIRRGRGLQDRLQDLVNRDPDSETRTSLASRWPVRKQVLEDVLGHLKALLRASPFSHVSRPEISASGLTALAADPCYARVWSCGWRALRHGLALGSESDRLWVSPSWEIYERWCFLRLGQLLSTNLPGWQWSRRSDYWTSESGNCRVELHLQPTFRSRRQESDTRWSISKERVPDLVLTAHSPAGTSFLVLDAKYRTSRSNVLDAMDSAHIYQDSLRIGALRPRASLLLVPSGGGAPWLEQPAFQLAHRVGICVFSPGADSSLPAPVRQMFEGLVS